VFIVDQTKTKTDSRILPLRNASEDFVKTVGRYIFNRGIIKTWRQMVAAFLENIRST
jgi:hypothetical protein